MLCDVSGNLIKEIGLRKAPSGTTRGVFVIDKSGKILAAEPGGPAATVEVVKQLVAGGPANRDKSNGASSEKVVADTAAEVANTAAKLDSNEDKARL